MTSSAATRRPVGSRSQVPPQQSPVGCFIVFVQPGLLLSSEAPRRRSLFPCDTTSTAMPLKITTNFLHFSGDIVFLTVVLGRHGGKIRRDLLREKNIAYWTFLLPSQM